MDELATVLLVDDEARNLEALEAALSQTDCRLVRAQSADEALLLLLKTEFAAIVLDIRMPGMDGIELAKLVRSRRRTRHVPILFLTAHLLEEADVLRGYGVGAVDYLSKPLNPEVLRAKIAVFADLYRKSRALSAANDALQREVVERERAEEALREANRLLERRVDARTAEVVRAHRILQASEERLRLALDAGRMGTWEVDGEARTRLIDEMECSLLGLPEGTDVIPLDDFLELVHPDDRELVRQEPVSPPASAYSLHGAFEREYRIVRADSGAIRWHLTRGRVVNALASEPRRTVGVTVDITERREAEEALRDADRRKNDFLATLAHELRNPLAPIRNAVEVLKLRDTLPPELSMAQEVIARQVEQLTRLVDDLLDISRITHDKLELRRTPVEIARIVQQAVETSAPHIERGRHPLAVSLPPDPVVVNADVARLAQVISNLLNNAARYSDPGSPIRLSVAGQDTQAVIRVIDRGVGIPPEMRARIFDMFVQLSSSGGGGNHGLGVGLPLARRLVEMHEGTIEVLAGDGGVGSEFVIRLPVTAATRPTTPAAEGDSSAPSLMTTARILMVDDNRDAVDSLRLLLHMSCSDIRIAYDGLEALRVAGEYHPDIVLLDIGLPGMNGYDVARSIRQQPWGRETVLVALTGWGQESDRRRSGDAGFDHHLVKPVEPRALLHLLSEILVRRRLPAPDETLTRVTVEAGQPG